MHALMIAYYIEMSLKKCINAPHVSRYKVKDDDEYSSDESTKKSPFSKDVMVSSYHSKV